MKLLLERESPGVLYVPTIHHVAEPRHPPLGRALEPDRSNGFAVDGGHLLARAQIGNGVAPFFRSHAISDAATGPTAVEAEHQTRPLGRPAMDEGIDAKGPMRAKEPGLDPLHEGKIRPPHQRTIGEHPKIFGSMRGTRIHGCDIEEYAASRKPVLPSGSGLEARWK